MRPQARFFVTSAVIATLAGWIGCTLFGEPAIADDTKQIVPEISPENRQLSITDIAGKKVQPLQPEKDAFSIILFTATECPIANAFSPEISRIAAEYAQKRFHLYLVYTDPELDAAAIRKHVKDYSLKPATAIFDRKQLLVRATGATHTPEACVIDSKGRQLYRGRVNNRYAALGKARRVITKNDLRMALQNIVAGKPVKTPRTEVIGCYIPTLFETKS